MEERESFHQISPIVTYLKKNAKDLILCWFQSFVLFIRDACIFY